ncbi:MAG: hypothetical protein ACQEUN_16740 [Pseudomonadota bacterium]
MESIIATSFDRNYFQQGLNLIASLHRTSYLCFDVIKVYDIDFTLNQKKYLNDLEKVQVVPYPSWCEGIFEGFLSPKHRAYKSFVIKDMGEGLEEGSHVLWMDAGLTCFGDISEIFSLIEAHDFFIPDHDDKPSWPFYNINFTHTEAIKALNPSVGELLAVQLCSCLVGYKKNGKYQGLIDEAFELGKDPKIVLWPKIPSDDQKFKAELNERQVQYKKQLLGSNELQKQASVEDVTQLFDYYGHRTQSIYSILVYRYGAPYFSAMRYRRSNDISSSAAIRNWAESAKGTDSNSSCWNLEGVDNDVLIYHHRGVYNNLEGLRFKRPTEQVFILGNGPSLRDAPIEDIFKFDTLGMNAAYRYWDQVKLYPTYYCCMDTVVLESHKEEIKRLIDSAAELGIRRFFLRKLFLDWYPEYTEAWNITFLEDVIPSNRFFDLDKVTTGSYSLLFAWFLGYRKIDVLGVDLNYVEKVEGAALKEGRILEIEDDVVDNPNYFFDGYQVKGDKFNPPNPHPNLHVRAWHKVAQTLASFPLVVTNMNKHSKVQDFSFGNVRSAVKKYSELGYEFEEVAFRTESIVKEQQFWRARALDDISQSMNQDFLKIKHCLNEIEKKSRVFNEVEYLREFELEDSRLFVSGWNKVERINNKLCRWGKANSDLILHVTPPRQAYRCFQLHLVIESIFDIVMLENMKAVVGDQEQVHYVNTIGSVCYLSFLVPNINSQDVVEVKLRPGVSKKSNIKDHSFKVTHVFSGTRYTPIKRPFPFSHFDFVKYAKNNKDALLEVLTGSRFSLLSHYEESGGKELYVGKGFSVPGMKVDLT